MQTIVIDVPGVCQSVNLSVSLSVTRLRLANTAPRMDELQFTVEIPGAQKLSPNDYC